VEERDTEVRAEFQVERIAFFSDAIFAIAITLLVLEIEAPHLGRGAEEGALLNALLGEIPKILGFLVSFLVVGTYWTSHHRLFRWIAGYDHALVWRNLLFLLAVSFIPFPTAFFSENVAYQTSLVFYAVCLTLVGVAQVSVVRHVQRHRRLQHPAMPPGELALIQRRAWSVPVLCLLSIGLSFVSLAAARLTLVAIPVAVRLSQRSHRSPKNS
jgi:uncharacterized membrane protein